MTVKEKNEIEKITAGGEPIYNGKKLEKIGWKLIEVDTYDRWKEVYRRYLKGDIIEYNLSYRTARDHILDQLKIHLDIFIKKMKNEIISEK